MHRRLTAALAGLLAVWMGAPVAAGLPTVQRKRTLGVWLTNSPSRLYYDRAEMSRALNELQAAGFNAIYPNVWSRGTTFHRSQFAPVEPALIKAGIEIDRKMLADLAVHEPQAFAALVERSRAAS